MPRVWTAADAGQIINPDGLINQIEGGIIQSTSWTLHEPCGSSRTASCRNWENYPILTMPDVPKVETVLIDRPNERSAAAKPRRADGAAAIANAFAAATGKRLRDLPFTPSASKQPSDRLVGRLASIA